MGKISRERDAEVAREAILEAAENVFAREGFDGARIDTIAAESGYNKSLIFHYFNDKEGLYISIIKRMKIRMRAELLEPLTAFIQSSDEMNEERVRLFLEMAIGSYLDFLTRHPRNMRMIAWEAAEGWHTYMGGPIDNEVQAQRASFFCTIDFLKQAQDAGVICQKTDVRFLVVNLLNMCVMHLLSLPRYRWLYSEPHAEDNESLTAIRQQIAQLVLYGIFNSPREGTH